jgi:hypothetical protein
MLATSNSPYFHVCSHSGVHTFTAGVLLRTAGSQTVSVNDTFNTLLRGSDNVSVSSASADHTVFAQQPTDTTADSVDCRLESIPIGEEWKQRDSDSYGVYSALDGPPT